MADPFPGAVAAFPRLRQSLLSDFDNCALSAKFAIDYEQGWTSHPAARGTLVHRVLAKCLTWMEINGQDSIDGDLAIQILEDSIRQHDVPVDGDPLDDEFINLPLREIAQARITVRTWAMYTRWSVADFAGIEKRLSTSLYYPDGDGGLVEREVTGKLDLLLIESNGEHAIVVDWKDTWGIPTETVAEYADDEISQEGYFQQRFYALLVFRRFPKVQDVTLREFYPRFASGAAMDRQSRPINPVREATVNRQAMGDILLEMSALIERFDRSIETDRFRPAPGSHCSYCSRPEACTIRDTARGEGRISSQAEAERVAGMMQVTKSISKQHTAALRAWANTHGEVEIKDAKRPRVYGPVVRQETRSPTRDEISAAHARGVDPATLYTTRDVVKFVVHTPEEQHPHARMAAEEELKLNERDKAEVGR